MILDAIQKGDVLKAPSGRLRIVRAVHAGNGPRKTWVFLTINRCSWTHRCYTLYNIGELRQMGYVVAAKCVFDLKSEFDLSIEREFNLDRSLSAITCCDVEGIS